MNEQLVITGYCCIRDNAVELDSEQLYRGSEHLFSEFSTGVYRHFSVNYPKFHKMDNLSRLGFLTTEILLGKKNVSGRYEGSQTGIILMNSSSSLDTDRNHQKAISDRSDYFPSPSVFVYTLPNVVIGEICIRHKITGEGNFFVMKDFNAAFMVSYISQLFYCDIVECCLAGWTEILGNDYNSVLFLIEKRKETVEGIANFEPSVAESIFKRR
ncbi:MAG TPA: hypothetical protein PLV06_00380 [Bacteroidales bacterium]|nr:hypothetical protein [Bacteroidales bacterium]HPF04357.1 hypothetical protein [Bacteroidales bacterium]HPJ58382.1 hypothetical protein [Bacteroidales bacterium]HPR10812.1 hypothetical protein [Bacteroidales bacterium]HRW85995.1 hypothetical protein [Bacteroidales bacterium]